MRVRRWLRIPSAVDSVTDRVQSGSDGEGVEGPAEDNGALESCQAREDVHDLVRRLREVLDSAILK